MPVRGYLKYNNHSSGINDLSAIRAAVPPSSLNVANSGLFIISSHLSCFQLRHTKIATSGGVLNSLTTYQTQTVLLIYLLFLHLRVLH